MHTDNFIVDHCTTGQTVEGIAELLPHLDREPTAALIIKAINSVDSSTFVISTQKEEVFGVLDFVSKQQADYFQ